MKGTEKKNRYIPYAELIVFFASLSFFLSLFYFEVASDIHAHMRMIQGVVSGSLRPPANFLYYLTVYTLAFFDAYSRWFVFMTPFVLSLSMVAKFSLTRLLATRYLRKTLKENGPSEQVIVFASLSLLLIFSLPSTNAYLGQIPPNVWHNSTTIFVMPFSIMLFAISYRQLNDPTTKGILLIAILCVLNVISKPSYFFVFAAAFPLMLLKNFGLGRQLWLNLLPVLLGASLTVGMYVLIFQFSYGNLVTGESGVAILPLIVWSNFSSNIPLSILLSLVFPVMYFIFYWRDLGKNALLQYATLSYMIAIAIFCLVSETGARKFHGNFMWQCVIVAYLLFATTGVLFLEKVSILGWKDKRNVVILLAFAAHLVAGLAYIAKLFATKNFL